MLFLSTAYLAPVEYYVLLNSFQKTIIEKYDNYIKQTYRNRCVIVGANGLQNLSIPIEKPDTLKCLTKDIRIADHGNWRHIHWNAIVSAYNSTPFFEYYADDFFPFYDKKIEFLFDFNEQLRDLVCSLLDITPNVDYSDDYINNTNEDNVDLRERINPKKGAYLSDFTPYYQVFESKYGFIPNLSIIDLLFNMGPEASIILNQKINSINL
ncbi:hypothetical protein M2138_001821 [Dysgonomonadaceae bacterium PH5-43]|nr:hypothetical protein [Dysgonomonadaceae bacterium PH5-43]